MIYGKATTTVAASPAEVRDLVCDLEQHKLADAKIRKVIDTQVYGEEAVMRFRSKLRGLPTPAVRQRVVRSGDGRVDITSGPSWQDGLVSFRGSVGCAALAEGTRVVHREEFQAHGPVQPLSGWFPAEWSRRDVAAEVDRLARLVSRPGPARGSQ